jgi:cyclophilin family peptidyl-prolyl cis-trans isomerase
MKPVFRFALAWIVFALLPVFGAESSPPPLPDGLYAEIGTPRGSFVCELLYQQAPLTVTSFVGLAEGTLGPAPRKPFFDGLKFHRVVPGFVVQGGDPLGTGEGGPGYTFADEFSPGLRHNGPGVLSMANDGPDTNGSQFFVTLSALPHLDFLHSVFGRVVRGEDVLPQIEQGDTMTVRILRVGPAAKAFRCDEKTFDSLRAKTRSFESVAAAKKEPGPKAHFDDPDHHLPTEPPWAELVNYRLANIERATGIRIVGRIYSKSPPAADDAPGVVMRKLATELGTIDRGVAFACFADEDDWRVWIGNELTTTFLGRKPSGDDLKEGAAFHHAKEAFLDAVRKEAESDYEKVKAKAKPDKPAGPDRKMRAETDAMVNGLIDRMIAR